MENQNLTTKIYVVFDNVEEKIQFVTLSNNDASFVRDNLRFIQQRWQIKDLKIFKFPIPNLEEGIEVSFDSYTFEDEAKELSRLGMKQEEIEAYFAERSKRNRGMTEKQIVEFMKNYIANVAIKE